jgi:hypothetical protein
LINSACNVWRQRFIQFLVFPDYVFGKVPLLEVGDVKLYQSVAIMHYLALQFGKSIDGGV